MNTLGKNNKILAIVLAVQLGLGVVTWATGGRAPGQTPHALIGVEEAAITSVEIVGKPGADGKPAESVVLKKNGADWVVASAGDFPAKKDKVEEIVKKLAAIKVRNPIATQAADHNALRVGKDTYAKDVIVSAGSDTKKLVVGSGSGSSINVRFADSNDVYQGRGISEYQLSNQARSYVETQYVKADTDKVNALVVKNDRGELTFRKDGGKWLLEQLPAGAELDESKVTSFVAAVARLSLDRPIGKDVKPEMGLDHGVSVHVEATDNDKPLVIDYVIGAQAGSTDQDGFYVKAKDNAFVVAATKWATESARSKSPDDFVKKADAPPPNPGEGMGMPPGLGGMPPGMDGMPHGFAPPE